MEKKVSIIVPTYNSEQTIEKCLNSLLQQTYKNIEIIVVNDGSKDHTAEILDSYQNVDERIVVIHKENSGVSDTRNLGIKQSTGSYISFIDSDDWIEKNMIEELVQALEKYDVDFVRCNHFKNPIHGIQTTGRLYELANKKYTNQELYEKHVVDHFLFYEKAVTNFTVLLLIRKELLINKSIYFDKRLFMLEDAYFYQVLFKNAQSAYFLDKPLYHYVENENSITKNPEKFARVIYGIVNANMMITKYIEENKLTSIDLGKVNANYVRLICNYLLQICIAHNKLTFLEIVRGLQKNEEYQRMIHNMNYSDYNIKQKIQIRAILPKNPHIKYILTKIVSILWQIKNRKK